MSATRSSQMESAAPVSAPIAHRELGGLTYWLKGVFDRVGAGIALVLLAIPFGAIAIAIKVTSPGPVFVKQVRVGRYGRPFRFWKFRSMRPDAESEREELEEDNEHDSPLLFKIRRDPRVTPLGRFLRRTSLDELPQLYNIWRGEMAFVGPRPIVVQELRRYGVWKRHYLSVPPGLTGLWQVSGRNDVSYDQRVALDRDYVEQRSWLLDALIVARTFKVIALRHGAR